MHITQMILWQPPSGGCVLKQEALKLPKEAVMQPPSGGCVLKQHVQQAVTQAVAQPPSGGCVLKHSETTQKPTTCGGSHLRVAVC